MGTRPIRKILIANRGEVALRIIRTCREMGIRTVAVYSEVDRIMPHVVHADEAYPIGPAPSVSSYLKMETLIAVAGESRADAIHPGYGFLSENPEFARRVEEAGFVFIGPKASSILAMGNKTEARRLVGTVGVPTVPGTPGPVDSEEEAMAFSESHGWPVLLKAAAGGGGKGMRVVTAPDQLRSAFRAAQSEARSAFGDDRVYVEKYLESPRHVEFQILADRFGNTVHLGERECSIQRRHQKVIEESPSTALDGVMRQAMGETAIRAARACGYENAGTIEFLVDREKNFYFLEMNTRLQVEHPVTEERTGLDIVAEQIRIARGEPLLFTQEDLSWGGHAIECRICAEDPENNYLPSTGTVVYLRPALGPGVREDRGIEAGGEISVYYDPMISKLIVHAPTRQAAIERMKRALSEYVILGVKTNIPLCMYVLNHPEFVAGNISTHFLQDHPPEGGKYTTLSARDREAVAAACAWLEDRTRGQLNGNSPSVSGQADRMSAWKSRRIDSMRT